MSKKEEQRKIKEEKQAAAKRKQKMNAMLFKVAIAVIVPIALLVFYQGLFSGPPVLPPSQVGDADHVMGAEDAALTITVYADFQCPACLNETQIIAQAWPQVRNDVRLVFRHFPLDTHRFAYQAARYAEAAGRQGRFWEMHDLLYTGQQSWSGLDDATLFFDGYAEDLGLDMEQFRSDVDLAEVRAKINSDQQGGIRAGVRSTPAMFFNGRLMPNPATAGGFIGMVNSELNGN